jgi:hypothetical protein
VGGEVTVPTGDYRVSSLLLTLDDPHGGPVWSYSFGDNGGKPAQWRYVHKGRSVEHDAVGKLDFAVQSENACKAGEELSVRPALYTGDGLLIERAHRGAEFDRFGNTCAGKLTLADGDGKSLAEAHSGFA